MSSGGGGGGGGTPANTTNVQTIREAPEIEARRLGLMDQAAKLVGTPLGLPAFQVAGLTAEEQQGITQARTGVGAGLPSIQAAETAAALDPSSQQFQQYMNPYQSYIVDEINRQAQQGHKELLNKQFLQVRLAVDEKEFNEPNKKEQDFLRLV